MTCVENETPVSAQIDSSVGRWWSRLQAGILYGVGANGATGEHFVWLVSVLQIKVSVNEVALLSFDASVFDYEFCIDIDKF